MIFRTRRIKGIAALALAVLFIGDAASGGPSDPQATEETRTLFERLDTLRRDFLLFGHQHTTEYGIGWKATDTEDSDVKRTTGAFPAIYGWDFFDPLITAPARGPLSMHAHALAAHRRGGINEFCWHAPNPVTGGSFYDTTPALDSLVPGGEKHDHFLEQLDAIAAFFLDLLDDDGKLVPVVFRPFHEHNGHWFWWGVPHFGSTETFAELWRFMIDYLREEKGVRNILVAWSPNIALQDEYFVAYPGDDHVDIFGFDMYVPSFVPFVGLIRTLVERAEDRGKIPAITEGGYPGGLSKISGTEPFTKHILAPLRDDPVARRVAWVLVWRNGHGDHLWVPPPGHPFAADFRAFHRDPFTVFGDTLPKLFGNDGEGAGALGYNDGSANEDTNDAPVP